MSDEGMSSFIEAIINDASEQKKHLLDELEEKRKRVIEQNEEKILNDIYNQIQFEIIELKNQISRDVSKKSFDIKKELLITRDALTQKVFNELITKIKKFKNSPDYAAWCKNKLQALDISGCSVIIECMSEDKTLFEKLCEELNIKVQINITNKIELGGFTAVIEGTTKKSNETLDERFLQQKAIFGEISGLVLS